MRRVTLLACLLFVAPAMAGAGQPRVLVPEGLRDTPLRATRLAARSPERPVHEPSSIRLAHPALASSGGGFVLVSEHPARGLLFGRLDATGAPQGVERLVAANTAIDGAGYRGPAVVQRDPSLLALPSGRALLVWIEESSEVSVSPFYFHSTLTGTRVLATTLRPDGTRVGPVRVLDERPGAASAPTMAALADGRLLVGWRYEAPGGAARALVRPLDGDGAPAGRVRQVDVDGGVGSLALAAGIDGTALALWSGCCDGAADAGVFARRLDRVGRSLGAPTAVNETTEGRQGSVAIAAMAGGYVAAWTHSLGGGEYRLRTRPLGFDGSPAGPEWSPGSGLARAESHPRFLAARDGSLQMAWIVWGDTFRIALMARGLAADGSGLGEAVPLTEHPPDAHNVFALAEGRDRVVVTWAGFAGRKKALLSRAFELQ